ncbi:MAG: tetratricopeptide repeat protein [Nitrospirae bacterium]|nr:tetratricopeptide repeat protein [Nitrospirota bacterium]
MTADELFEKGLALLKADDPLGALSCFEKAYNIKKTPQIQSYLAYCIAAERGKITEAIAMCHDSLEREPDNPLHYLNLGRIYLKADRKTEALEVLRRGLSHGDNQEIKQILEILGKRKKPIIPFLPRNHFLNKYIGLTLSRLQLR